MNSLHWQPGVTLEDIEKSVILMALKAFQNNKTQTARALGIAVRTLDNKLAIYRGEKPNGVDESGS